MKNALDNKTPSPTKEQYYGLELGKLGMTPPPLGSLPLKNNNRSLSTTDKKLAETIGGGADETPKSPPNLPDIRCKL